MRNSFLKLLQFFAKKQSFRSEIKLLPPSKNEIARLQEEVSSLKAAVQVNEQDKAAILALFTAYTKKIELMNKIIKNLSSTSEKHTKNFIEAFDLLNQHAVVINANHDVFKEYLDSEGLLEQFIHVNKPEINQLEDALKMMTDKTMKKDSGKN